MIRGPVLCFKGTLGIVCTVVLIHLHVHSLMSPHWSDLRTGVLTSFASMDYLQVTLDVSV